MKYALVSRQAGAPCAAINPDEWNRVGLIRYRAKLHPMAASADSLGSAISQADGRLTVLDDRLDAEDHAAFLWMRAHQLHGYAQHRVVIGTESLPAGWRTKIKKFADKHVAVLYLRHFEKSHAAMYSLRTLAKSLCMTSNAALTDAVVLEIVSSSLAGGRAWLIELPKHDLKSRFISKTSPQAFAPLNPRFSTKIDFTFIASLEGNQWHRGYVPMKDGKVIGRSGMTVASGFDLGQWSLAELQRLNFQAGLMKKLTPFAAPNNFRGKSKAEVAKAVGKLGPVPQLTQEEADLCDGAVFGKILGDAIAAWDRDADDGVPKFTALPSGWQTVWLSRVYQEGSNPQFADANAFRDAATSGKWQDAIAKLRAYHQYASRTKQEADLLARELPAPVGPAPGVKK